MSSETGKSLGQCCPNQAMIDIMVVAHFIEQEITMHNAATTSYHWPEPIEAIYQMLGGGAECVSKVPYLPLPIALFIAAVVNTPRQERPWGIITWTAETFH